MGCNSCGCCLGAIFGFLLALAILAAAAFGVYCYFNPEARNSSINVVETQWIKIKSGGDDLIEQSRGVGAQAPGAKTVPAPAAEPEVKAAPEPAVTPAGKTSEGPFPLQEPSR